MTMVATGVVPGGETPAESPKVRRMGAGPVALRIFRSIHLSSEEENEAASITASSLETK
jgi:hypothetical protein